eukprot:NODE_87_length_21893_cov_0.496559.p9 type:complete len:289 gc:universal NODE_87_length_21893_cov_0.496559:11771-10905(-)
MLLTLLIFGLTTLELIKEYKSREIVPHTQSEYSSTKNKVMLNLFQLIDDKLSSKAIFKALKRFDRLEIDPVKIEGRWKIIVMEAHESVTGIRQVSTSKPRLQYIRLLALKTIHVAFKLEDRTSEELNPAFWYNLARKISPKISKKSFSDLESIVFLSDPFAYSYPTPEMYFLQISKYYSESIREKNESEHQRKIRKDKAKIVLENVTGLYNFNLWNILNYFPHNAFVIALGVLVAHHQILHIGPNSNFLYAMVPITDEESSEVSRLVDYIIYLQQNDAPTALSSAYSQ